MKIKFLKRAIKLVWDNARYWVLTSIFVSLIKGFLPLAFLWVTKLLIDEVSNVLVDSSSDYKMLFFLLFLQFVLYVFQSSIQNLKEIIDTDAELKIDLQVGKLTAKKSINVPYSTFELPEFFYHHNRIKGDYGSKVLSPIKSAFSIVEFSISLLSLLGFLLLYHWILVLISILTAIPILLIKSKFGNKKFHLLRYQTPSARESNYLRELLHDRSAAKEVRIFDIGTSLIHRWESISSKNNKEMLHLLKKQKFAYIALDAVSSFFYGVTALVLIWLIHSGMIKKIGDFVALGQAFLGAQNSINMISTNLARIYEESLYIEDLFNYLDYSDKSKAHVNFSINKDFPTPLKKGIYIKNLQFNYPGSEKPALKGVNITIKTGEKIAIVGENGSGKTTLVKCILGLYQPTVGQIFFDEVESSNINLNQLWGKFTVIFQDFIRYPFSVRDNIAFGDIKNYDDWNKLVEVSKTIGIDDLINSWKEGFSTKLGKILYEGRDLSGGQWQKIGLARAIFRNSEIFILDEPTAAVDPKTEVEIFSKFNELTSNKTSIIVTHRMAAAKLADRILVMKDGELVEEGTHEELMLSRSEYFHMFNVQSKWYE
ncbi:ABC transporter ATP-binding protein [Bacillus sp. DJP31]|uniref:ABC transporter ATP-binding protein n=1 Tax=Bacillus sp. DJP31 TaxID=3409789 RepID=UPI003BB62A41